jgi:predicted small lipoprotein YifL
VSRPRPGLVALVLLWLVLAGCGKKGPPIAPETRLPLPPAGLGASIDEGAIQVTWTNPGTRYDGTPLKDLTEARLYRREDSDDAPLKPAMLSAGRVVGYDEIAAIRIESPAPATVQGGTVRWVDQKGLVLGHRYVYVVTAIDALGRSSPPSERRAITYLAAPKPPQDVQVSRGDRQVMLTWRPPAEFTDGSPASGQLGYFVMRGAGREGPLTLITPQPLATAGYTDTGLENNSEYRYAVRSVRLDPRAVVTGAPSPVLTAIPAVTTPPRPPSNLVAIPSPGALRLAWSPSTEANVVLYAVYRAVGTGAFIRIGTALVGNTTFVDRDVRSGTTYRYAVSALDNAREPNESARSNEVSLVAP